MRYIPARARRFHLRARNIAGTLMAWSMLSQVCTVLAPYITTTNASVVGVSGKPFVIKSGEGVMPSSYQDWIKNQENN